MRIVLVDRKFCRAGGLTRFGKRCLATAARRSEKMPAGKNSHAEIFSRSNFSQTTFCSQLHGLTKDAQHGESLGVKTGGVAQRLSNICRLGAALDRK
jgi:hypothetical protein